ncbi:MAG: DUF4920 domain-containing protein [Polyangiaceae bacterium]
MRTPLVLTSLAVLLGAPACECPVDGQTRPTAASTSKPANRAALVLGQPISASETVAIADVAHDPGRFEGRTFATTGKVTAVCQEAGCWMEIGDDQAQAHVRMHGHSFFVPKTASGRVARVQATVVAKRAGSPDSCEGSRLSQVELDATGVELD